MLRKSGLFLLSAVLLSGCDLFTTREFRPKPIEIRSLPGLSRTGDSAAFLVTESLWDSATGTRESVLSRRRLAFVFLGDSLEGTDTLKVLSLRITDDSSGVVLERSERLVRFTDEGVLLSAASSGGGARFFPLKATSTSVGASGQVDSGGFATGSAEDGLPGYLALPAFLVQGWADERRLGVLDVRREQIAIDTLPYQGHLEEAWGIAETVLDSGNAISNGMFWYGVSGLLKADQSWSGFDWRDESGIHPDGVELRRAVERE